MSVDHEVSPSRDDCHRQLELPVDSLQHWASNYSGLKNGRAHPNGIDASGRAATEGQLAASGAGLLQATVAGQGDDRASRPQFTPFGQHEPATIRIRNIINQYVGDAGGCRLEELVKELLQNSDDAKATEVHFVLDKRQLGVASVWPEWRPLQGPALCFCNDSIFTENDIECIQKLGVGSKGADPDKTGQFGIGFNVVYQLTDCPALLSDGHDICMFDPHLRYVPGACDERPGGRVDLSTDEQFTTKYADFMSGFLGDLVPHAGCTVFRLPLRSAEAESDVCDMGFAEKDVDALEEALQSVDFRIFLHSALLFTKSVESVRISVVHSVPDGAVADERVCVRREVVAEGSGCTAQAVRAAYETASCDMRDVMLQRISPLDVQRLSLSYVLRTADEFVQNDWLVTQNFGFHGDLSEDDLCFLSSFFCEDSKKFLPVGGVAAKLNSSVSHPANAYAFLPLPICTGLPVHVNGHFAIHSSRRAIWQHTAYGEWNKLLRDSILVPAYCDFLLGASHRVTHRDLKQWFKFFPDVSETSDEFFRELALRLFDRIVVNDVAIIPVDKGLGRVAFVPPSKVLFACSPRNSEVESVLTSLAQDICSATELALRFKMAGRKLHYLKPSTALVCLKAASPKLSLPCPVGSTCFLNASTVALTLQYVLEENVSCTYSLLDGCPLCLTIDGNLRIFSSASPVFVSHGFRDLILDKPEVFLHPALVSAFKVECLKDSSPAVELSVCAIAQHVASDGGTYVQTPEWTQLLWKLIKKMCDKSSAGSELLPLMNFAILPVSDGSFVKLADGRHRILSVDEASRQLRKVIGQLGLPLLDASRVSSDVATDRDIYQFAAPFVLNAVLPEALLEMLTLTGKHVSSLSPEDCETLLQYFSLDCSAIIRNEAHTAAFKRLPIFEDVDGVYKALQNATCIVMDNCIPTYGISSWMERSDCFLLKEKTAYSALYHAIGLVKKNAVQVYLDDIFPHFSELDPDLRLTHLTALRTHIVPMLQTYATEKMQESFWSRLRELPFVPLGEHTLLTADRFADPDVHVLTLIDGVHALSDPLSKQEWRHFLTEAGLRNAVTAGELLECAVKMASGDCADLDEATAKRNSQILLSACLTANLDHSAMEQLSVIRFIPLEPVPVDRELLSVCPAKAGAGDRVCLRGSLAAECNRGRLLFNNAVLVWSVAHVLPSWLQLPNNIKEVMGVKESPSVADVCQHCLTLVQPILTGDLAATTVKAVRKVIAYVFDYLLCACECEKHRCIDCSALQELRNCPCVSTRGPSQLWVRPNQLVLHSPSDVDLDLLAPHIFVRPTELSKYDGLLARIGARAHPTPDVYAEVLRSIWTVSGCRPLNVNDKQAASMAVYGLFSILLQQPEVARLNTRPLYLPSDKAVMSLSTELVADDSETVGKTVRAVASRNYDYVCSLSGCGLARGMRELISCLPKDVRPRLLSELVQERVRVGATCPLGLACPLYLAYNQRLHSTKFARAVWLLAPVPEQKRQDYFNDLGRLKILEVSCVEDLVGYLLENSRTMENTERSKRVHIENTIGSSRLYLSHQDECPGDAVFITEVAAAIKSVICYKEKYYLDTGALTQLLQCSNDAEVEAFLMDEGLQAKEDDMSKPKLGSVVPLEHRANFGYDPDMRFQPKEYIGYVKPRPPSSAGGVEDSDYQMIYARILRESQKTEGTDVQGMFREYEIDVGQGYSCMAQSLDLFREMRHRGDNLEDGSGLQVVVSEGHGDDPLLNERRHNFLVQDANRTVTRLIEEVFSDPRRWREREKLRRRLLLQWHPDKVALASAGSNNGVSTELATEVFKHLQKEFKRVEDSYRIAEDSDSDEGADAYEWEKKGKPTAPHEAEAKSGSESEQGAVQHTVEPSGKDAPAASAAVGDLVGAALWLQQAARDLACAHWLHSSSAFPEWLCAICCEVVRKVMVATVLALEPARLTSELASTRLLGRLHYAAVCRLHRRDSAPLPPLLAADLAELHRLGADDTTTRQPGVLGGSGGRAALSPSDVFTPATAEAVMTVTDRIFDYMKAYANLPAAHE